MTINSAADHGYTQDPPQRDVRIGDTFRVRCALGVYESRVSRAHRSPGYYETVVERWITEVPAHCQSFVGGIDVMSHADIFQAKYAD